MRPLVALVAVVALLAGCAGVPDSSAPQAIGTVERPEPERLPEPNTGMNPDQLLREFLKATADPADRHRAARQFLTESASKDWDDGGSALLIDKVVFTETRSADRVAVTMKAQILGSLSDVGVFETGEGELPDPGPMRQKVHLPQDSFWVNERKKQAISTMQSVSSSTINPPDPIIDPAPSSASKSTGRSASAAGMQPPEGPPI